MRKYLKGNNGDSGMVPVYVLIGVIVIVTVGFIALNQFVLVIILKITGYSLMMRRSNTVNHTLSWK